MLLEEIPKKKSKREIKEENLSETIICQNEQNLIKEKVLKSNKLYCVKLNIKQNFEEFTKKARFFKNCSFPLILI